jgi:hypothetical protein
MNDRLWINVYQPIQNEYDHTGRASCWCLLIKSVFTFVSHPNFMSMTRVTTHLGPVCKVGIDVLEHSIIN